MTKNIRADLKILVIGSSGTGKTSFVQRWTKGDFNDYHKPTIVSEFGFKIFEYKENKYRIQLWDIGGQDKSPSMARIFARDSHGCLVVSDGSKPETFKDTLEWKNVMNKEGVFIDGKNLPFVLIQNKIDLIEKDKLAEIENQTKELAENNEFVKYYMSSVKENINVNEAMDFLIGNIIDRLEVYAQNGGEVFPEQKRNKSVITLKDYPSSSGRDKKSNCC
jgi:small GTP-binding protein